MATVPLRETGFVTLDINGNGTVQIGPLSAREVWHPSNAAVSVTPTPPVNEAICKIYAGDQPIQMHFVDGTFSGSSGDSTDSIGSREIKVGWKVWAVWTGGDVGAIATLVVTGSKDL